MGPYAVAGAGDSDFNDPNYTDQGVFNGEHYYSPDGVHFLFLDAVSGVWVLSKPNTGFGGAFAYYITGVAGATPPASGWSAQVGSVPAPTVTLGGSGHRGDMFLGE